MHAAGPSIVSRKGKMDSVGCDAGLDNLGAANDSCVMDLAFQVQAVLFEDELLVP